MSKKFSVFGLPRGASMRCRLLLGFLVAVSTVLAQGFKNLTTAYSDTPEPNRKDECYTFLETDLAAIAKAFGCLGLVVDKPADFKKAFEQAMASELPVVIDCRTEFAAQAPMPWVP